MVQVSSIQELDETLLKEKKIDNQLEKALSI